MELMALYDTFLQTTSKLSALQHSCDTESK